MLIKAEGFKYICCLCLANVTMVFNQSDKKQFKLDISFLKIKKCPVRRKKIHPEKVRKRIKVAKKKTTFGARVKMCR